MIIRMSHVEKRDIKMTNIERLLAISEVCQMLGRGRASLYRDIKSGKFPQPVRLGGSSRWPLSEVQAHIKKLIEARRGEVHAP